MSDYEQILEDAKKLVNNQVKESFSKQENQIKKPGSWDSKNHLLNIMLGLGAGAVLFRGRAFQRIAGNMQQMIKGFYDKGKFSKAGSFLREAGKGTGPATRQVFNQRLSRAYKEYGFGAGQKKDLDRIFKGYSMVLNNPKSWVGHRMNVTSINNVLTNPKLTEEAAKQITFLGKQELGVMHNAFAQQVKIHGIDKAKKGPLYNLIKHEAKYMKFGKGPSAEGAKNKFYESIGLKDPEVGKIALGKWNQGLVPKLRGIHKDAKSINVANFRHSAMQKSAIDTQFSSQAKIAFLAHEAGLMNKGKHLKGLADFFHKRGYGEALIKKSDNHYIVKGKTYVVNLHKTQKGSTLVNFSPARKSNYHWGGFNGNLVFNETAKHQRGKVGIFGTDVYDIEIMKLKGDKWANFRKTPLLNVQDVKYKTVPIINPDKVPKKFVQRKTSLNKHYNTKLFNDEKLESQYQQIVDKGKYGVKDYQSISPYAEERFKTLAKPTKGRLKGGAIVDARGPLHAYTRHSAKFNKAVEDYYKLYTTSMKRDLTVMEQAKFAATRAMLGLGGASVVGSAGYGAYKGYEWLFGDDD